MTEAAEFSYGREPRSRPRRWLWWLSKWILRIAAVLLFVVVLTHSVWLVWASARLNRAISALAAAGEPTTPATLQPLVPAGHNAYDDLVAAAAVVERETSARSRVDALDGPPQPPLLDIERRRLSEYVADSDAAVRLIEQADHAPVNVMAERLMSPVIKQSLPSLNGMRKLAYLQVYRAELAHDSGHDGIALKHLDRLEPIAVAASHPFLIGMLVGIGVRSLQADQIMALAPTLRIGPDADNATPEQVRAMIAALLDSRALEAEQLVAYRGERVMQIDTIASIDDGSMIGPIAGRGQYVSAILRYGTRPYLRSNELTCVETTTAVIGTLGAPDWPTAKARINAVAPARLIDGPLRMFVRLLMPSFERSVRAGYRIRLDRSLAAVALASRLYTVETGKAVARWKDIVPLYLPDVPADPLTAGRPLQARWEGDDPIVWSVGENGTDEGGSENSRRGKVSGWACEDRVLHLTARPRDTADFSDDFRRLIDLDLDSPIATATPATRPSLPAAVPSEVDVAAEPNWENIVGLTVWGEPNAVNGLVTRRDVYLALVFAVEATTTAPRTAPVASTQPYTAIHGTATFDNGVWRFTILNDGTLTLTAPNGTSVRREWQPHPWQLGERAFWR